MHMKTFIGYNCFSSAVGQYASMQGNKSLLDIIGSQWTFFYSEDLFWKNCWYAGASIYPVDILLIRDLHDFAELSIREEIQSKEEAFINSKMKLKEKNAQIILVDFFYLNSVNWDYMKRFHIFPQHDSHFIILTEIRDDKAIFIDPYYSYKGEISLSELDMARNHETVQGMISYQSYEIGNTNERKIELNDLIRFRFNRFLKEKMYLAMEEFAIGVEKKRLIEGKEQDRQWAIIGYNCLRSIVEQRYNLRLLSKFRQIELPQGILNLENKWSSIRKMLFEFYSDGRFCLDKISYELFQISILEKEYAYEVIERLR